MAVYPGAENVEIVIRNDEVGSISRRYSTEHVIQSKKCGRVFARHSNCLRQVQRQERHRVLDGLDHRQGGSRESASLIHATTAVDEDCAALEREGALIRTCARHRVGNEHDSIKVFGAERDLQHDGINVMAIDNEAAVAVAIEEGGS